jgi:hypothetical protein
MSAPEMGQKWANGAERSAKNSKKLHRPRKTGVE